jgi:hypothetical protein
MAARASRSGQGVIVTGPGRAGSGGQQVGAATPSYQSPGRQPQRVLSASPAGRLDDFGQGAGDRPFPQCADPNPDHIPVDRVAQPDLDPAAVDPAVDQVLGFQALHRRRVGQLGQLGLAERLAQGEQLEHRPLRSGQMAEPQRHQLHQATAGTQLGPESPVPALLDQGAGFDGPGHQLSQDQRVAFAAVEHMTERRLIHGPSEHHDEQLFGGRVVKGAQLNAFGRPVFPERDHRVRRRLAPPHGRQNGGRPGQRQLVHQSG